MGFKRKYGGLPKESDLPHNNVELVAQCKLLEKRFAQWSEKAKDTKQDGMSALEAEISQGRKEYDTLDGNVIKQLETVSYMQKQKGQEQRSSYQQRRWRCTKLSQAFVAGKYEPGLAKFIAAAVNRIYEEKESSGKIAAIDPNSNLQIATDRAWADCDKLQPALWHGQEKSLLMLLCSLRSMGNYKLKLLSCLRAWLRILAGVEPWVSLPMLPCRKSLGASERPPAPLCRLPAESPGCWQCATMRSGACLRVFLSLGCQRSCKAWTTTSWWS